MEQETRTKPFVVSVEGNIGSGKSSMLKCFENMSETVTTVPGNFNVNMITYYGSSKNLSKGRP